MAENEDWEILSDSSKSDCVEIKLVQPNILPQECTETQSGLPKQFDSHFCLLNKSESQCPQVVGADILNESSCSLSDSYSSMPPLIDSTDSINLPNDGLLLDSNHDIVKEIENDPMMTIREYIAAISLLQLRQHESCPIKKVTKKAAVTSRPMTRLYKKKLTESILDNTTVQSRPMTRLYKKQLGL